MGSNHAGGMDVCRECCVLSGRGLYMYCEASMLKLVCGASNLGKLCVESGQPEVYLQLYLNYSTIISTIARRIVIQLYLQS